MANTVIDLINLGNLLIGTVIFCLLFARTSIRSKEYPREVLLLFIAKLGLVAALLLVSLELILINDSAPLAHVIFLTVFILVAKTTCLWAMWRTRKTLYRTGNRHAGIGLNADEFDVDNDFANHPREGST